MAGVIYVESYASLGADINGEVVHLIGYTGDVTLSLDCKQIDQATGIDPLGGFGFALTDPAAGRYTLAVDGTREDTGTGPFATASDVEWSFDFDPASIEPGQGRGLVLPAVGITADDVDGGGTEHRDQEITLQLSDGEGRPVTAQEMAFDVSYDDGRTWTAIDLVLDGSSATVELDHPENAEFVSTRMTATDEAGTEVSQTTIRAYGLR